jgi:hypothetical protein
MGKKAVLMVAVAIAILIVGYLVGRARWRRPAETDDAPALALAHATLPPAATPFATPVAAPASVESRPVESPPVPSAAPPLGETAVSPEATATAAPSPTPAPTRVAPQYTPGQTLITVYFLHHKKLSPECVRIQDYTGRLMGEAYMPDLDDGKMDWRNYNLDAPSGERFRAEFGQTTDLAEGVWERVNGTKEDFMKYLQNEIEALRAESKADTTP